MRRLFKTEELQGKRFCFLVLLKHDFRKVSDGKNRHFWLCQCDCGKQKWRREDYLISGKTESCGCKHPTRLKTGPSKEQWKGCGEISGQYFSSLKYGAKNRDLEFNITIEKIWELFLKQKRKCAFTGWPLQFVTARKRTKELQQTASLDRIDSLKGYTEDNVQWIHKDVNLMKNNFPLPRFLEVCEAITANLPQKFPERYWTI